MKTVILVVLLVAGVAAAQGSGAADPPPQAPAAMPAPPPVPAQDLHKICADAMNADPVFARSIVVTADKQIDAQTIKAHDDATKKIAQEDSHVIYAYGALWVISALLVAFMWMRQQKLKTEIEALRRDLTKAES